MLYLPVQGQSPPAPEGHTNYVMQQWTVEDGLPVNSVNDIVQTDDGYLWLATYDGLVRFDGVQFTVYQSGDYDGLPSSRIIDVHAMGDAVWLLTESQHLVRFKHGTFRTISLPDASLLYQSQDQSLWVGTVRGLYRVNDDGTTHPVQGRYIQDNITALHQTESGHLWIGTNRRGVYRHQNDGQLDHLTTEGRFFDSRINSITSRPDGSVLIGAWNGLWTWTEGTMTSVPSAREEDVGVVFELQSDNTDTLWIRTEEGIYQLHEQTLAHKADHSGRPRLQARGSLIQNTDRGGVWINTIHNIQQGEETVFSTSSRIAQMMQDHEDGLWIATQGSGIYHLRPSQISVYGSEEGIGSGNIYPILQRHDESVWLGSLDGGLTRITPQDTTTVVPQQGNSVLSNIWSLHETPDSTLWVGGSRLCQWDGDQCLPFDGEEQLNTGRVLAIHEDNSQNLWVGSIRGLYRRNQPSAESPDTWFRYTPENSDLPHRIVRVIYEANDGTRWFGTNGGGVAVYHEGTFYPLTEAQGLPSNLIRDIYQDEEGTVWVATEDAGLARIEWPSPAVPSQALHEASITTFTTEEGLFDDGIHRIIEDNEGRLWMSTNRGLFWVQRAGLNAVAYDEQDRVASTSYTERDGLRNREANGGIQPAGMQDQDGRIWFPTQAGAAVIDAAQVRPMDIPPPVHIEQVVTPDSTYRARNGHIELQPHERNFDVVYTAISFVKPDEMQFAYQLHGVDSDWRSTTRQRRATYTNIAPGTHTFAVRASSGDGVWNENGATIDIKIQPHFYETWWFYGLVGLLGIVALGGAYWIRTAALGKRKEELERTVQARTEELRREKQKTKEALDLAQDQARRLERIDASKSRFFARISHEFRTPLTLTLGPVDYVLESDHITLRDDERNQLRIAQRNATRLARLVNQLHDLAKLETGTMTLQPEQRDIVAFVSDSVWTFQGLAEHRNITLTFASDTEGHLFVFDPPKIEKVIANLLTNAFQATRPGDRIEVTLDTSHEYEEASSETVVIRVEDTGTGMPSSQFEYLQATFQADENTGWDHEEGYIGIGLNLVNELVALHDGQVHIQSKEGIGTTFTIHLPQQEVDETAPPTTSPGSSDAGGRPLQLAERALSLEDNKHARSEDDLPENDQTTVLIVDDNADFRSYLRWHLEPAYRVVEAENGTAGYQTARSLLPDIAVVDIMMPGMDGLALCQAIKNHPDVDQIPVIFLTALDDSESRVQGYEVGGDAYLTKPFNGEELKALIENLVSARQTLRPSNNGADNASLQRHGGDNNLPFDKQLESIIEAQLADPDFGVAELASAMAMSPSQLRRQMDMYYDRTPVQLIRYRRLEAGAKLLKTKSKATIGEVAYAAGFNSQSYFSRSFKKAFGVSPSVYRKRHESTESEAEDDSNNYD